MRTYVALFRGVNVGGRNILPMKRLVALLEDLNLKGVRTYIQSGNAVFQSEEDASELAGRIGAEIEKRHGFEPRVHLLQVEELQRAVDSNPFPEAESEPRSLHLSFLASTPRTPDLAALEEVRKASERFRLEGPVLYLHAPDGIGRSKLAADAERLLGVPMTSRNWRTVSRILAIAKDRD